MRSFLSSSGMDGSSPFAAPHRAILVGVCLVVATMLVSGAPASAAQTTPTTFGTNLAAFTPENGVTCADLLFGAFNDCTFETTGVSIDSTEGSFVVPTGPNDQGAGTITAFNVKVGSSTGPMQILLLEALREVGSTGNPACCKVVEATQFFTPTADSTTTIRVDWPTENDNVPNPDNGVLAFDQMAISVGEGVALPIASDPPAIDGFYAPACPGTVGTECDYGGGYEEYVVTMDANWTPTSTSSSTPTSTLVPILTLGHSAATVKGATAQVPLTCATASCVGTLTLQNLASGTATSAASTASKHKRKLVTYGNASYSLAAGKTGAVKVKLNSAGKKLLKAHNHVSVYANVTVKRGSRVTKKITLNRVR